MSREAHVRFCESAGLRCPALLTFVEGRLRNREYEAKVDGRKQQRTEIVASRVQFLGAPPAEQIEVGEAEESGAPVESEAPF
jgi:single-stranded DNA-binding protein